jgi:2-C-methyl-D-erythritol 4-phosphate cytidylyltransferase
VTAIRCWGVIPAAGLGRRLVSDIPKQYLEIDGRTLLEYSLDTLLAHSAITRVVVAIHAEDDRATKLARMNDPRVDCVIGGAERSASVLAALIAIQAIASDSDSDWVLVHDAARPCLQLAELDALISKVKSADTGGILAQPVVDTVKQASGDNLVVQTLDRRALWRAQTPQMFRLGPLRDALVRAAEAGYDVTDEASAMELAGHPVQLVAGSSSNLKVTVAEDLGLAQFYLRAAAAQVKK